MTDLNDATYRKFVQTIIDNIKKNGFPEKKVAFDLEKMYESAANKEINFNKVLATLDEIQIAHTKTPEKIIFHPKEIVVSEPSVDEASLGIDPSVFANMDPSMFGDIDPSMFANVDMSNLKNMNMSSLMGAAAKMMKKMSPEQMNSMKDMYKNMSDEQKSALMDKAQNIGFFNKDKDKDKE